MTALEWVQQADRNTWAASTGDVALFVSRRVSTGEWTWRVRFGDGREITARVPYLARQTAQVAAELAAVRDA